MKIKPTQIVVAVTLGAVAVWWFFFRRQPVALGASLPGTVDGIVYAPLTNLPPSQTTGLVPTPVYTPGFADVDYDNKTKLA